MTERNENNEQIASSNLMADQEVPVQQEFTPAKKAVDDDEVKKVHFAGFLDEVLGLFSGSIGYWKLEPDFDSSHL
ncbi:hypothetical protein RCO48_07400 [Peribacillus frigoritolerans]|nr:hypothetical protein [Peribacillus frigoritolerans]